MSDAASRAVFLSYARDDAAAAKRIAEALRGFGLEVWFDQSELRGGDAWDAKIRGQIKTCTLFMPVVSARTEERSEGYFRREWKLAVDRTHDMGAGRTFILPVVIDDIKETAADVPEEFMRYQWTRLPGGEATPEFVAQVKRLLEPKKPVLKPDLPRPPTLPPEFRAAAKTPAAEAAAAAVSKSRLPLILGVVAALAVAAAVFFALRKPAPVAEPPSSVAAVPPVTKPAARAMDDKSVAVLPFTNMSDEKEGSSFVDGIQEDILTNLALVRALRVVSRTSVMQYRGTTKTIREIARELGVAYILEGSVQRAGNKVRVTGQLIKAATDEHVWAKSYDRDLTDIFSIQSELSQAIAAALSAALSPQEKELLARRPTENLDAYDAYVKAREMALASSNLALEFPTMQALLQKAVTLDPNFAAAWGEMARINAFAYFSETDRSPERLAQAKAAIEKAARLAPDAPEVIECQGDYWYYGYRDYARAAEQYQRLAVLRPNDADVFGSLGLIHRRQGRMQQSLGELRHAAEVEPRNQRWVATYQQILQGVARFDEALVQQQRLVDLSPPDDLLQQQLLVQLSFMARGSTREMTEWAAKTKAGAGQEALLIVLRKANAILVGDWGEAVRLDGLVRYYDGFGFPRWAQDVAMAYVWAARGDQKQARAGAEQAIAAIRIEMEHKPSAWAWQAMAQALALTGSKDEARQAARRAMELVPEANDAVQGPVYSVTYAQILAWTGDKEAALAELARLLRTPFGENIYLAKAGPFWLPLRDDPRFQALVNDPKNNQPMF